MGNFFSKKKTRITPDSGKVIRSSTSDESADGARLPRPNQTDTSVNEAVEDILSNGATSSTTPKQGMVRNGKGEWVQIDPALMNLSGRGGRERRASLGKKEDTETAPAVPSTEPSNLISGINIDAVIERLLEARGSAKVAKSPNVKQAEMQAICAAAREVFLSQPVLLELQPPVKIVGDIHGQFLDLLYLFDLCGSPATTNYLFLGDYVDRGKQSLETILLLLCYKLKYPQNFFLLRGNHESAAINRVYGFYDECKRRCSIKIWKCFTDVFNVLPIAAVVAGKIFCVHGGLSPGLHNMRQIKELIRPTEVPDFGLLSDLLWSDPSDTAVEWEENDRGVSYTFGKEIVDKFLDRHRLDLICRAHMVVEDGYEFFGDRGLVTIFSAPNYCGEFDNLGAVMSVDDNLVCSFELIRTSAEVTAK